MQEMCAPPGEPVGKPTLALPPVNLSPDICPVSSAEEFAAALEVRIAVFVREQGGPAEDEPDEEDAAARHFLVRDGDAVVGTARLCAAEPGVVKIGRVALLPEHRGRGWGRELMLRLLQESRRAGCSQAVLHAQVDATPFYERLGFVPEGEEFIEGGIRHRKMRISLR